jgi:hypothetical protein
MPNIFTRSPYIVEINVTGQVETKIELYLWNSGSMPSAPQYILSKLIAATNAPATYYDLSPYISEFIDHNNLQTQPTSTAATPTNQYVNFLYRRYRRIGNTFAQVGSDVTGLGFDGFGYYAEGSNPVLFDVFSDKTDYYYNPINNVGWFTAYTGGSVAKVKYTNYSTSATQTITLSTNAVRDVVRVYAGWEAVGNRVDFLSSADAVLWTANVYPKTECKYTPVQIDFVNKYGAWQREWFFKASYDSLNVENTEYNLMQSTFPNYLLTEGQREIFNANGKQTIRVNTDWVDESFKEKIKQLMLSEKILVNETAAKLNTKSMDLKKSINSNLINYEMEFEFAYDVINSVM